MITSDMVLKVEGSERGREERERERGEKGKEGDWEREIRLKWRGRKYLFA
jgi:hypothetical protein